VVVVAVVGGGGGGGGRLRRGVDGLSHGDGNLRFLLRDYATVT
jgi:hypothetical protein